MMKATWIPLCALLFVVSCACLPDIRPANGPAALAIQAGCDATFPVGKWQFVHTIEATLPGGRKGLVMGVTVVSSAGRAMDCIILSPEGLVLFEARQEQDLVIRRAVFPFEEKAFAEGLVRDVQLMFLRPDASLSESGFLENGSSVCRHQGHDGKIVDIITHLDHAWEIREHGEDGRLTRTVEAWSLKSTGSPDQWPVAEKMKLVSYGFPGYELTMTLVDAVLLSP